MSFDFPETRGVLFDLDGTFADTAPDLADALNRTLRLHGRAPLAFETIRPHVSHGGMALIRLGFGNKTHHEDLESQRQDLLRFYQQDICRSTRLFDGMAEVLETLDSHGIFWGIVTNKPAWLTEPLIEKLGMARRAKSVVSGDTCPKAKPYPEPILHACTQMGVAPGRCVYVGDAERDIQAGRSAGTATVAALYGYLDAEDEVEAWQADAQIRDPRELLQLLNLPCAAA